MGVLTDGVETYFREGLSQSYIIEDLIEEKDKVHSEKHVHLNLTLFDSVLLSGALFLP